jgi:hypothetical protein
LLGELNSRSLSCVFIDRNSRCILPAILHFRFEFILHFSLDSRFGFENIISREFFFNVMHEHFRVVTHSHWYKDY